MSDQERVSTASGATWFIIAGGVLLFGLVMLGSATAPIGAERFGSAYYFLIRQICFGLIPGAILFFLFRKVPITFWERNWKIMLAISVGLLALVWIPTLALRINGSRSWVHLFGISMQPAEFVKFTFIIFLAGWLAEHRRLFAGSFENGLLKYLVYVAVICGMLLLQPDVGTMLVFFGTAAVMAFIGGAQIKHLGILATAGVVVLCIMIAVAPYRLQRITVIFNPDSDPLGSGYHIKQALTAVGSGGFLGKGLGNSRQKFQYLPEVSADSIFAIIAEEMGFILSSELIVAYLVLVLKGMQLARATRSEWAKFFMIGTVTWIGIQTFFNIGAMLAVLPLTGLPLPLVSHGGSSLMVTLAAFGVISAILLPPKRI